MVSRVSNSSVNINETSLELDSHADTCVVGRYCLIINDFDRPVTVYGYDRALGAKTYRTVSAVLEYIDPVTGQHYHLVIHQAIEIPHLDHHLLCPMQCEVNDVTVNHRPKYLCKNPTEMDHAIITKRIQYPEDPYLTDMIDPAGPTEKLILPLCLQGVTSFLPVSEPSREEWDAHKYPRIDLTSHDLTWDPQNTSFQEQEAAMTDAGGTVIARERDSSSPIINSVYTVNSVTLTSTASTPLADFTTDDNLATALLSKVQVSASHTSGTVGSSRGKAVDALTLAKRWNISLDLAKKTVQATTQRSVRQNPDRKHEVRFPTNDRMLRYPRMSFDLFTDTLLASTKSLRGNKGGQAFATPWGWGRFYPTRTKGQAHETLNVLFKTEGVPPRMIMDNSWEQGAGPRGSLEWKRKLRAADCLAHWIEPYSPWQNACETNIRECKRGVARKMLATNTPKQLWDYCMEMQFLVRSHTALDIYELQGQVPETVMKGRPADISRICQYGWFDWVEYLDSSHFEEGVWVLGRYLGPSLDTGTMITVKVIASNGQVFPRSTVRPVSEENMKDPVYLEKMKDFMSSLHDSVGAPAQPGDFPKEYLTPEYEAYESYTDEELGLKPDNPRFQTEPNEADSSDDYLEGTADDDLPVEIVPTPEADDNLVGAEVMLPLGGQLARGRVTMRKRDRDGNVIGRANDNPILDTREYVVEFDTGEVTDQTANVIAQNLYSQCDEDGHKILLFDSIIDHRRSTTALTKNEQRFSGSNGREYFKRSTAGWQLCVKWADGTTTWEKLKDFKESYPVETAEYAVSREIDDEPAFNWWVKSVLQKRDRIISKVAKRQTRYLKRTTKFGIELPKTVAEALALDKKNGNTKWADAIAKEMKNVKLAFDILPDGEFAPRDHTFVKTHMVFDIKMEDFRRKARLVAGGHMTEAPKCITYSSVVQRDTVRIALTMASLNKLQVKAGDIENAYITAPCQEKIWTKLGPEFGADEGKKALIIRAIYGLKSSGAAFRSHLADCMETLKYKSCRADNDLWIKRETNAEGLEYYSYILCYVDDIMVIHHDAMPVLMKIDKYFKLKPSSIGDPDMYLGAKLKVHPNGNGTDAWTLSSSKYVQEACGNCEKHIATHFNGKYKWYAAAPNPFKLNYEPELDTSDECDPEEASYFGSLIGVMRWIVELGRVDIHTEVSILSSFLAMPRTGHLDAAIHIMSYLQKKHNARLMMDPEYPNMNIDNFNTGADWKDFYGDIKEAIPADAPEPLGNGVDVRMFTDSDHAGDKVNRRSRTGWMIYINMALIMWCSQKQPTVESSVFGAEFVAMKSGIEAARGLRYKLRMMGIPINGPTYIFGDNMSVIYNTSKPESTLKKKSNSICYHAIRESVAMGESMTAHVPTEYNLADLLTKVLYGLKKRRLVNDILWDVYDPRDGH